MCSSALAADFDWQAIAEINLDQLFARGEVLAGILSTTRRAAIN